jgi:hypothetical protein
MHDCNSNMMRIRIKDQGKILQPNNKMQLVAPCIAKMAQTSRHFIVGRVASAMGQKLTPTQVQVCFE